MGCRSDYQAPSARETDISRLYCFLDELSGKSWTKSDFAGFREGVYQSGIKHDENKLTASLCSQLRQKTREEILEYSLELQIWWRDHQRKDAEEAERKEKELRLKALKEAALAKLSEEEKDALGLV